MSENTVGRSLGTPFMSSAKTPTQPGRNRYLKRKAPPGRNTSQMNAQAAIDVNLGPGTIRQPRLNSVKTRRVEGPSYQRAPEGSAGAALGQAAFDAKVPLGGSSARQVAQMQRWAAEGQAVPDLTFGAPRPGILRADAATGGVTYQGMPDLPANRMQNNSIDMAARTQNGGHAYAGMRLDPPAIARAHGGQQRDPLANTASTQLFIPEYPSLPPARQGARTPFRNMDFSREAANATNEIDQMPNPRVPHIFHLSRECQQYTPVDMRMMPLFVAKKLSKPIGTRSGTAGDFLTRSTGGNSLRVDGYTLPACNLMLARMQRKPSSLAEQFSPTKALATFSFMGSVYTDQGAKVNALVDHFSNERSRNIVAALMGPVDMFNLWDRPRETSKQYFVVKGVRLDKIRAHLNAEPGTYNTDAANGQSVYQVDSAASAKVVIQILPFNGRDRGKPEREDLLYEDNFGRSCLGLYIEVGYITQIYEDARKIAAPSAFRAFSAHSLAKSGRVEMNLQIGE